MKIPLKTIILVLIITSCEEKESCCICNTVVSKSIQQTNGQSVSEPGVSSKNQYCGKTDQEIKELEKIGTHEVVTYVNGLKVTTNTVTNCEIN